MNNDTVTKPSFSHTIADTFDSRRDQWYNNGEVMRENFFKHPHFPQGMPTSSYSFNTQSGYNRPVQSYFDRNPGDGQVHYIAKFFLPNVNAKDINVDVKGNQLTVSGRTEVHQPNSKHVNEFNQSVDLPRGINEQQITATLLDDGILVVDCVMHPPDFDFNSRGSQNISVNVGHGPSSSKANGNLFSSQCVHPSVFDVNLEPHKNEFHIEVPLGGEYSPEEIKVKTMGQRIFISARHEERGHNRTAFREFSKEYDIPSHINPEKVVSKLCNGILHVMVEK